MRAYLSLLMVVALGMGLQAPVQAQTTTTTTKKEAKKTAKKTEVKTEVVKAEEVKPVEVKKEEEKKEEEKKEEEKKEEPKAITPVIVSHSSSRSFNLKTDIASLRANDPKDSLVKYSAYWGFDYVSEPQASVGGVVNKDYKKQRAIVYPGFSLTYDKKWNYGFAPEFRYNNGYQTGGYPTPKGRLEYVRGLFNITRKNVLNEKDHGFNLDVGYVRRVFNKGVLNNNGNHRLRTVLSKTVNDKINFSIFNEILYNATDNWAKATLNNDTGVYDNNQWKFIDNIKPRVNVTLTEKLALTFVYDINVSFYHRDVNQVPHKKDFTSENHHIIVYTINDKYSLGSDFKFNYSYDRSGNPDQSLIIAPYTTVYVTPTTSISFEVAWTYSQANDNYDGFAPKRNFHQYPDLAIYFFQTLF